MKFCIAGFFIAGHFCTSDGAFFCKLFCFYFVSQDELIKKLENK